MAEDTLLTEGLGVSSNRLRRAFALLEEAVASGAVPGIATALWRYGKPVAAASFGRRGLRTEHPPVERDTIFLLASLTKPIVCAGVMLLVQDGKLALEQPVASLVPEFGARGKENVLVRHLLTHTSGLPDQLAQNIELRTRYAPLSEFVKLTCQHELLFSPGTKISYQSMGILMLAEIVERMTGQRLRDFLQEELFLPLGMEDTTLGMPRSGMERTALAMASADPNYGDEEVGWGWNSTYWRDLGAPWGGLHSTTRDLGRFLNHMLGYAPGPLSLAARRAMTRDQTTPLPGIPVAEKLAQRWGLGWMLGAGYFGSLVSPQAFGHIGATGTLYWADPESRLACVLLTNQPQASELLFPRYSNAIASAIQG